MRSHNVFLRVFCALDQKLRVEVQALHAQTVAEPLPIVNHPVWCSGLYRCGGGLTKLDTCMYVVISQIGKGGGGANTDPRILYSLY